MDPGRLVVVIVRQYERLMWGWLVWWSMPDHGGGGGGVGVRGMQLLVSNVAKESGGCLGAAMLELIPLSLAGNIGQFAWAERPNQRPSSQCGRA